VAASRHPEPVVQVNRTFLDPLNPVFQRTIFVLVFVRYGVEKNGLYYKVARAVEIIKK